MAESPEDLDRRLHELAARWQGGLPEPGGVPVDRLLDRPRWRTRHGLVALVAAAAVLAAVAVPVALLGSEDRDPSDGSGQTVDGPDGPDGPVPPTERCRPGTKAAPGRTFTFFADIPMMSAPPQVWTLTREEATTFRGILARSRDGIDEIAEVPEDVGFAGYLVTAGAAVPDLGTPAEFRVYDDPAQGPQVSPAAAFLGDVARCRSLAAEREARDGPVPEDGYLPTFCAHLVVEGRTYEVGEHQEDFAPTGPVGSARGSSCGSAGDQVVPVSGARAVSPSRLVDPREAVVVFYRGYHLVYVPEYSAELVPVPYPQQLEHSNEVRSEDLALAREFSGFAVDPGAAPAGLFAADGVRLGLGPSLRETDVAALRRPASWGFAAQGFAGRDGRIDVLDVLREHLVQRLVRPGRDVGRLAVAVGETTRCASPPAPPPPGLEGLRHVSLQPATGSIESCLDWFAVDLYVDTDGAVVAVSLDLLEP